ncbi:MAG: anthranilate synthase component I, partial [Syntrophales bacterium]|nr:anthranilate synthase component I [Syntrophales bacterium]
MIYPSFERFLTLTAEGNLIPLYAEILADRETPVRVLERLGGRPSVFLLESVEGGEKWGRYSFLGAEPRTVVRIRREETVIEEDGGRRSIPTGIDPLAVLREMVGGFRP